MKRGKILRIVGVVMGLFLGVSIPALSRPIDGAPLAPAQLIVVNSAGDEGDPYDADNLCDICNDPSADPPVGPCNVCTLRAAIEQANASAGADEIFFSYVAQPIRPATALPYITEAIAINGIDQGHGGSVWLDGVNAPAGTNGLWLASSNSTIRGMTVTGFRGSGTYDGFGIAVDGDNNVIEGNYLGTNPAGDSGLGNGNGGLIIAEGADNNRIGGTTPAQRNVISGNDGHGVQIGNALTYIGASNNRIIGNYIGVAPDGQTALGNGYTGVSVFYATSTGNQIGGTAAGERNIIAGNGQHGVGLDKGTSGNVVQGNTIGADASGTSALPNANVGVMIHEASNNTVGGTTAAARNVIVASGLSGVEISVPPYRAALNASPLAPTAPTGYGLRRSGQRPVSPVAPTAPADGNVVQGNFIGLDAAGTQALGNGGAGVTVHNASQNTIGGTAAGAGNVIAGNGGNGVILQTGGDGVAADNVVQGNLIGLDASGMAVVPNQRSGVMIYNASQNQIGGAAAGAGNVIAGNRENGLLIQASGGLAISNTVQGNVIGAYRDGSFSDPDEVPGSGDDPGNGLLGVGIEGASGSQIGGDTAATRNLIVGNAFGGVYLMQPGATDNHVQGNFIGALADLSPAGNGGIGVWIAEGSRNLIGGTGAATNTIAFNAGVGVMVEDQAIRNTIQGNAIYLNRDRPVDLDADGFTPNDLGDADTGANQRQNFPTILAVTDNIVTGTLNSAPNTVYRLDFYAYEICDFAREFPAGYGDGDQYLTFKTVATDARGNAAFTVTLASALPAGYTVAATATDPDGNTSEFSNSPYKLRVSSEAFIPKAAFNPYAGGVPEMHVLLYSALDELQATALESCGPQDVDLYVVVNGDTADPRKMTNDGAGRTDRAQADFNANDVHHSLWFTPTAALTYTLDLYVVEAGKPFAEALRSDGVQLTPNPRPELAVLTDLRELFQEFNLTDANAATEDRNANTTLDYYEAVERIRGYAAAHQGVVLDVRQDAYDIDYSYADADHRHQAPLGIDWLVARLPGAALKSIAIIGDDAVVPFYRYPDPKADDEGCYLKFPDAADEPCKESVTHNVATVIDTQDNVIVTDVPYSNRAMTTPKTPDVDWGLGRIFAPAPLALITMIEDYEKPAVVGSLTGSAFTFNIPDEVDEDGDITFDWQNNTRTFVTLMSNAGYVSHTIQYADRGKPRHRLWDDGNWWKWRPAHVQTSMDVPADGPRLTVLNSHANHLYNTTPVTWNFLAATLDDLASFPGSVFVDTGCHAGYATGADTANVAGQLNFYTNALVRAALERGITYHASTTYGQTTASATMRFNDRVHYQFLRSLFAGAPTVGEAHRRAIRTYYTYHPRKDFEERDVIGVYGTELYGLPTQPIKRAPGGVAVRSLTAAPLGPIPLQLGSMLTVSFDTPVFRITTEGDATRFEIPNDGETTAVGNGPEVPLLVRTVTLPADTSGLTVTLVASDTALYTDTVQLPLQRAGDRTWGVSPVPFTGTALYPADLFWTTVYSDARGVQLTLSAIPLRYDPLTGQVTLYHHLDFLVEYDLPDAGTRAPTATPRITTLSANGDAPVSLDQASFPMSLTVTVAEARSLTLRWLIEDAGGQPLRGGADEVALITGTNGLAWEGDSLGWQPGEKVLHVQLETGDATVIATAQMPFQAQGRGLRVTTDQTLYGPDATQATVQVEVRDETGALVPGLTGMLAARLNGATQPLAWTGNGLYTAALDVSALDAISYTLTVALDGGPASATSFSVDRIAPTGALGSPAVVYAPEAIPVTLSGDDDLSGVARYRLQYRVGETGAWTDWLTRETTWNYALGQPADLTPEFGPTQPVALAGGVTYYFRVQTVDRAGNVEAQHTTADAWTTYVQPRFVYLPLILRAYVASVTPTNMRYVKRYGDDLGDCRTPATACGTLQYTVDVAQEGDVIAIAGYEDVYTLENPGGDARFTYWQTSYRPKPDGYYGPDNVSQVVLVDKSLTLRGGYAPDFSAHDPAVYKTVLRPGLSGGAGRGVLIAPFVAVTLENLTIIEGDATGQGGVYHNTYGFYDAGGGVYALGVSYRQDALIIRDCVIAGNRAASGGYAEGGGIYIENRSGAQLTSNAIYSNTATGGSGQGGGVMVRGGADVRLETNTIASNTGSLYSDSQGGGIAFYGLSNLVVQGNAIAGNVGSQSGARVLGGGLYMDSVNGAVMSGNVIRANVAGGYDLGAGGGLSLYQSRAVTLRGNTIVANIAAYRDVTGNASGGGGVRISSGCADIVLENNLIARNQSPYGGSGLLVTLPSSEAVVVTLRHNTFADNRVSESRITNYESRIKNRESRIENRESVERRLGELANDSSLLTPHSSLLAVPQESQAIMTVNAVTLNAVNTLIAGHTRGVFELYPGEGTLAFDHTLWHANVTDADPTVIRTADRTGDPAFVAPAGGDYHIGAGSAARDAGASAGVTTDIDGDARDALPDIGADEYK